MVLHHFVNMQWLSCSDAFTYCNYRRVEHAQLPTLSRAHPLQRIQLRSMVQIFDAPSKAILRGQIAEHIAEDEKAEKREAREGELPLPKDRFFDRELSWLKFNRRLSWLRIQICHFLNALILQPSLLPT